MPKTRTNLGPTPNHPKALTKAQLAPGRVVSFQGRARATCARWRPMESLKLLPKGIKLTKIPIPCHLIPDPKHNMEQLDCWSPQHTENKGFFYLFCFSPYIFLNLYLQTKALLRFFLHSLLFISIFIHLFHFSDLTKSLKTFIYNHYIY